MTLKKTFLLKREKLLIILFITLLFLGQLLWHQAKLSKIEKNYLEHIGWYQKQINECYLDFSFQSGIEGQIIKKNLQPYLIVNDKYLTYDEFIKKHSCVFHLAEIGCNECYIHEFDIIREKIQKPKDRKEIAIITTTRNREFIMRLIKDYASDFDVYQIDESFFEQDIEIEEPFFTQFNSSGVCYNTHKSSKQFKDQTSLYLENLYRGK